MINKDRIVPITKTDLLTLFYTIQALSGSKYAVAMTSELGVYDIPSDVSSDIICSEPVKKMNIGSEFDGSIYFIPDRDFEGITYNGAVATFDSEGDEIIADGASLYTVFYDTDVSALKVINCTAVGNTGTKIDATPTA